MLKTKRVYDKKESDDGTRILVDRLWPRGLSRDKAFIEEWMKDIAPSNELRKWYGHNTDKWKEFKQRYFKELESDPQNELVQRIRKLAQADDITLLYSAKDTDYNNAEALKQYFTTKN